MHSSEIVRLLIIFIINLDIFTVFFLHSLGENNALFMDDRDANDTEKQEDVSAI